MNTLKVKTLEFAGSIQKNVYEYLQDAIGFHYAFCNEDMNKIPEHELRYDASNIVDNIMREAQKIEFPDNSTYTRSELEDVVYQQIKNTIKEAKK